MPSAGAVRNMVVDSPNSLGARYRARRWDALLAAFPDLAQMSVIDLGGRPETWLRASVRPRRVCVVNLEQPAGEQPPWISVEQGNACDLDERVASQTFDLVFSNAVIEHVGGHANRMAFARTVELLADQYWIQTPYRYFPIEPHWLFPFFQHLPVAVRGRIAHRWPLVYARPANRSQALSAVMDVELLSRTDMHAYFPQSRIVQERVGPFVKSLIAVRTAQRGAVPARI